MVKLHMVVVRACGYDCIADHTKGVSEMPGAQSVAGRLLTSVVTPRMILEYFQAIAKMFVYAHAYALPHSHTKSFPSFQFPVLGEYIFFHTT